MCVVEGCIKFVVFAFNFIFVLAGSGLITIGVLFELNFTKVTDAIPEDYSTIKWVPILTIVIGSIVFLISFFGCCGAAKSSPCLLTTYSVILLVLFMSQIALGVFIFLKVNDKDDLKKDVENAINTVFTKAKSSNSTGVVDVIQQQLHCCGVDNQKFWDKIPSSCYDCTNCTDSSKIYEKGCANALYDFILDKSKIIGITVLALSGTEVIGAILSLCLANSIRNSIRRNYY